MRYRFVPNRRFGHLSDGIYDHISQNYYTVRTYRSLSEPDGRGATIPASPPSRLAPVRARILSNEDAIVTLRAQPLAAPMAPILRSDAVCGARLSRATIPARAYHGSRRLAASEHVHRAGSIRPATAASRDGREDCLPLRNAALPTLSPAGCGRHELMGQHGHVPS